MEKEHLLKEYSVSEKVRLVGVESHVLRYWEEELGLEIQRTRQGHRIYTEQDVETLCRVKELKEKGIQLKGIKILLKGAGEENSEDSELKEGIQRIENAYPAVLGEGQSENLRQFEAILKRMIQEVVEEQNEKLKQALSERLREELEIYFQYREASFSEAAAAKTEKEAGWLERLRKKIGKRG